MKKIPLSKGYWALVDDADFTWLSLSRWRVQELKGGYRYAVRTMRIGKRTIAILMHRAILGLTERHVEADHRDHNGLNNQRSNLRAATHKQNMVNRMKKCKVSSNFLGVYFDHRPPRKDRWRASIKVNGKTVHLGSYATQEDAASAYNAAALRHHGEFACLN